MTVRPPHAESTGGSAGGLWGRETELATIEDVAQRLAAGHGSVVVWLGEPGIGKTSLLRAASDMILARVSDVETVHVSGRGVRGGPLAAVGFAIRHLLPLIPPIRSEYLDRLLMPGADEDPEPGELLRVAVDVLRSASQRRPILITVDDALLARDGNWAAVSAAAAQITSLRAAVLVSEAGRAVGRAPLTSIGPLKVRRLEPLSAEASVKVVRESAAPFVPRWVAARLGRRLAGNPSALREVSAVLSRDALLGIEPLPNPLPASQSTVEKFRPWLESLDASHFSLLLAGALALRPRPAVLEAVSGAELDDLEGPGREPWARVRHGLVEFVDPRLESAVLRAASHRQINRTHAALAQAFDGTDALAEVWHRAEAGEVLDDASVEVLAVAAEQSLTLGDYELALTVAQGALEFIPAGQRRGEIALTAGTAAFHCGYIELAATLLHDAVSEATDPTTRHGALVALCLSVAARDGSAPYALIDAELAVLESESPDEAASLACLVARLACDVQEAEIAHAYLRRAESTAGGIDGAESPAQRASRDRLIVELAHTRGWVRSALPPASDERPERQASPPILSSRDLVAWDLAVRHVAMLTRAEAWQEARYALAELRNRQRRLASRMTASDLAVVSLELHDAVGAIQEASDVVGTVIDDLPLHLPFAGIGLCLVARTLILRNEPDAAQEWLEAARRLAQSTGSPAVLIRIPAEEGLLATVQGDADQAARLLSVAVQRSSHFGHHAFAQLQLDLLEAKYAAGLETRTGEVLPVLEKEWGGPDATSSQRAMLAAARLLAAPPDFVVAAVLAAVDAAEWQASPLRAARVTLLAARVLGSLGPSEHEEQVRKLAVSDVPTDRDKHRRSLYEKAHGLFVECGATALARLATTAIDELRRGSATPEERDGASAPRLTADELRVATMVAGGATNRQVANTTYVSVRTVELRLTSVYRKLGIRSRKELADALATIDQPRAGLTIVPNTGSPPSPGVGASDRIHGRASR